MVALTANIVTINVVLDSVSWRSRSLWSDTTLFSLYFPSHHEMRVMFLLTSLFHTHGWLLRHDSWGYRRERFAIIFQFSFTRHFSAPGLYLYYLEAALPWKRLYRLLLCATRTNQRVGASHRVECILVSAEMRPCWVGLKQSYRKVGNISSLVLTPFTIEDRTSWLSRQLRNNLRTAKFSRRNPSSVSFPANYKCFLRFSTRTLPSAAFRLIFRDHYRDPLS